MTHIESYVEILLAIFGTGKLLHEIVEFSIVAWKVAKKVTAFVR